MRGFVEMLLSMSTAGAFISVVIMLLRIPLRKAPRKYSYMLWAILGVRLLCPFSLPSPASLFNLFSTNTSSGRMTFTTPAAIASPTGTAAALPAVTGEISQPVPSAQPDILPSVLFWVWAAGTAAFAVYWLLSWVKIRRRVSGAVRLEGNVYECGGIDSAFVLGLIRPRIYLPTGLSERDREFIIAHEQTHIRRRDYIVKPLAMLALCIHWFNPLAWISFFLMVRDMEISCDERVVSGMDANARKEYAAALLGMSVRQNRLSGVLAFGESSIKQRIKSVLSPRKPTLWISIAAVVLIAAAAVCLLTNSSSPESSPVESTSSQPEITGQQEQGNSAPESVTAEGSAQSAESAPAKDIPDLDEGNAAETVNAVLNTFRLVRQDNGDVRAEFSMPEVIPQDPDGRTKLFISLGCDYYLGEGTYSNERFLDTQEIPQGSSYSEVVLTAEDNREFQGAMLRAAFMTEVGDGVYREYYAGYVSLDGAETSEEQLAPARADINGDSVHYYFSGDDWTVTLGKLPARFTLDGNDAYTSGIPVVTIMSGGRQAGVMGMYAFGTSQQDELAQVDPAGDTLPMQIYSAIGLSGMVDYSSGYKVISSTPTGSSAVAYPTDRDGNIVNKCVYAFDYSRIPYFVMISFDTGSITDEQLEEMAGSVTIAE